jgi:hypothetical protein
MHKMPKQINKTARSRCILLLSLALTLAYNAAAEPPASGLVGYWSLNEGTGLVASDSSGLSNNGTLAAGVQWVSGQNGTGVEFNSSGENVRINKSGAHNLTGNFTVSLWLKPKLWEKYEYILSNGMFQIFHRGEWSGDTVYLLVRINSSDYPGDSAWSYWAGVRTTQEMSEDKWYSVIGVVSGTNMTIYLNGVKSGEVNALTNYSINSSAQTDLYISGSGSSYFSGAVDEVRLWNRSLTQNEVLDSYQYPPMFMPIGDMNVTELSSLRFTVIATDALNTTLNYSASGLPSNATFASLPESEIYDPYSSGYKFSWRPASNQTGVHGICFSVSNGATNDSECINITVTHNCLLNSSVCPSGFVCQGDGICAEDIRYAYGANAKIDCEPLGGGVGYSGIVDSASADYVVSNRTELLSALNNSSSGDTIYVADAAVINMTGDQNIVIKGNVTLASGRGRNNSLGALIYSDALLTFPLFKTSGSDVRLTGIRLQGPDSDRRSEQMTWLDNLGRYYDIPNSRGIQSSYPRLTVDNCELYGWSHAAVFLISGSNESYIHHNYIHHNQRSGLGYGVTVDISTTGLIEANIFDWNRHSIAGGRGAPGASYTAIYNLVYGNANGHYFDMHGGNDVSNASIPAGGYVRVYNNTFMESGEAALGIRGVPVIGVWAINNWAAYNTSVLAPENIFAQWLDNLPGHTPYEKMNVSDNWYNYTPPQTLSELHCTVCALRGNNPPCDTVTLSEVVNYINAWVRGEATLADVIQLINAWVNS